MVSPQRIQRRRVKGWRMPAGAVYVGRGAKWGNPFRMGHAQLRFPRVDGTESWEYEGRLHKTSGQKHAFQHGGEYTLNSHGDRVYPITWHDVRDATREECVALYREYVTGELDMLEYRYKSQVDAIRAELAGKDLACWCAPDVACHADVLLELANPGTCDCGHGQDVHFQDGCADKSGGGYFCECLEFNRENVKNLHNQECAQ